jgi:hypothetical protein
MSVSSTALPQGTLVGLTSAELADVRAAALQCLIAGAVRGINYTIANRTFSFPSLESAQSLLAEANYAAELLTGQRSTFSVANFNPALGRR